MNEFSGAKSNASDVRGVCSSFGPRIFVPFNLSSDEDIVRGLKGKDVFRGPENPKPSIKNKELLPYPTKEIYE